MLWPLIAPLKITCVVMVLAVITATIYARFLGKSVDQRFFRSCSFAIVLFVPAWIAIAIITQPLYFGTFEYLRYDQVQDARVERYLPPKARNITVEKYASGHLARYTIPEKDLREFLDSQWKRLGHNSAIPRNKLNEGRWASRHEFEKFTDRMHWPPLFDAIVLHSPKEADGGGAIYYIEGDLVYHDAGYW